MRGKHWLAVLMSLVLVVYCVAVPAQASTLSAPNRALCLTKDDFYFCCRNGECAAYKGYTNYLDWHDYNQEKSTNWQFSTWTHC